MYTIFGFNIFTLKYERRQRRSAQVFIDRVPEEMLFEILARLPVKSLLQFRCVCKSWNTLITSPIFKNSHLERNVMKNACDYLLIHTREINFMSVFNAKTYDKCFDLELPRDNHVLSFSTYGSYNGLLCLSASVGVSLKSPIYLWNPSIRKFKRLPDGLIHQTCFVILGFGFHLGENDYKVVKVARFSRKKSIFGVEVYSLRSDSWRIISAVPPISHHVCYVQVEGHAYLNGVVYWIIRDTSSQWNFIISFDMGSEIFHNIMLPDRLARAITLISIKVFEKSLFLFHRRRDEIGYDWYCDIWVLEKDTWKMIRTILLPPSTGFLTWPFGFRTNEGIPVVLPGVGLQDYNSVLYDSESDQVKDIGIELSFSDKYIDAYSESLILLN